MMATLRYQYLILYYQIILLKLDVKVFVFESSSYLISTERISVALKIDGKLGIDNAFCRSSNQSQDEFRTFSKSVNSLLKKDPFLVVLIGDFNVKLKSWKF